MNLFSGYNKRNIHIELIVVCAFLLILSPLFSAKALCEETENPIVIPGTPGSFSGLVKSAKNSVVNISTIKIIKSRAPNFSFKSPFGQDDPFNEFFERFFKDQVPREFRQQSLGSGFIIDKKGLIITNNHVVEKTDEIKVTLANKKEFKAAIVGRDPKTDLALIRIESDESLEPLPLGDSDNLEVGEWVIAIGNPYNLDHTVTAGIVSAKYRKIGSGTYDNFIQTDASINPGNSGGPLLNTKGEVIGINSAIYSGTGGNIGIGFAIPINMAKELLPQLQEGRVIRGWLGVIIQTVTEDIREKLDLENKEGALVADVTPDGPAMKAGVERGDVIVSFDGKKIREMEDLPFVVGSTPVGKAVSVEVVRDGKLIDFTVKIGELEEEKGSGYIEEKESDLGMIVEENTSDKARQYGLSTDKGLIVTEVESNTPASEAGIIKGDIIIEMDREPVKGILEFNKKIHQYKEDDTVLFLISRGGNTLYLTLKIWEK
jgi:serine protease Do